MNFLEAFELLQQGCKVWHPQLPEPIQVISLETTGPALYLVDAGIPITLGWELLSSSQWSRID
jgi:hypothetical protein